MFACLCVNPREVAPIARLREWRNPAPPEMVRVNVPGGAPFFRLEVTERRNGIPWNDVERAAGRCRTRVLFPEGVFPPSAQEAEPVGAGYSAAQNEPGLRAFEPRRLPLLHCLRIAQQVLRRCETPAQSLSVTVVDPRCAAGRALEPLVMLAGSLRLYTPDIPGCRAVAAQLLERYGITLILSDSVGCFAQSDVVVAGDTTLFTGRENGLVFTPPDSAPLPNCRVCHSAKQLLPESIAALCPDGIDPLRFAAALYELCGVREMERLQSEGFVLCHEGREEFVEVQDLAAIIDARHA